MRAPVLLPWTTRSGRRRPVFAAASARPIAGSGAGAGSGNEIKNVISAYIKNSSEAAGTGISTAAGAVRIKATDEASILSGAGAFAFGGAFGGTGVGGSIGVSVSVNEIENTVDAYVTNSTVRATGGNVEIVAAEAADINALTIGGAVGAGGGGSAGVGVGLAGAYAGEHDQQHGSRIYFKQQHGCHDQQWRRFCHCNR